MCPGHHIDFNPNDYRYNPAEEFMGLDFDLTQPKIMLCLKVLDPFMEK
jgi:hypothetical protein